VCDRGLHNPLRAAHVRLRAGQLHVLRRRELRLHRLRALVDVKLALEHVSLGLLNLKTVLFLRAFPMSVPSLSW
jgi:hypothetical protein